MVLTGGCLCGAIRYSVDGAPLVTAVCHCRHCQRQSGSAFSVMIAVKAKQLTREGDIATYRDRGDSGGEVARHFCPKCGSPLFSTLPAAPAIVYVKAGTLDDVSALSPGVHLWTSSAQQWVDIDPAAQCFERNAQ